MVKNKIGLSKEYHIQPSEIDRMIFFEYEQLLEEINVLQKQEEEARAAQQKEYGVPKGMNMSNFMPKQSSFQMPKITMPSFQMPKL